MRVPVATAVPAALAVLSACVPRPAEPPPTAVAPARPVPAPVAARPVPADWRDWPATPGTWSYRRDPRGSVAAFAPVGREALLTLRCDPAARRLYLSRTGGASTPITVRTSSVSRVLAVQPGEDAESAATVALAPGDPLLDAIGFSRGRFTVEQAGLPPLAIPAWAEIERVTEDCRG